MKAKADPIIAIEYAMVTCRQCAKAQRRHRRLCDYHFNMARMTCRK